MSTREPEDHYLRQTISAINNSDFMRDFGWDIDDITSKARNGDFPRIKVEMEGNSRPNRGRLLTLDLDSAAARQAAGTVHTVHTEDGEKTVSNIDQFLAHEYLNTVASAEHPDPTLMTDAISAVYYYQTPFTPSELSLPLGDQSGHDVHDVTRVMTDTQDRTDAANVHAVCNYLLSDAARDKSTDELIERITADAETPGTPENIAGLDGSGTLWQDGIDPGFDDNIDEISDAWHHQQEQQLSDQAPSL